MSQNNIIYTTITPTLGGLIIVLNTLQYYCIRRIQRMESGRAGGGRLASHHNLAYIKSLCASDILAGVTMVVLKSMTPFMKTSLKGDKSFLMMKIWLQKSTLKGDRSFWFQLNI